MQRMIFLALVSTAILLACSQTNKVQKTQSVALPVLLIKSDSGKSVPLQISQLLVNIEVAGNIATTTFDITFTNALNRVLEGEFEFPLADGQNISRYALEMEGTLREGVVVEKQLARVAFENTIRQQIDPGLVEKTKGNNFRTRVYPIPANGIKRIVIGIEQALTVQDTRMSYSLPIYLKEQLKKFGVTATVLSSKQTPELQDNQFKQFSFSNTNNDWKATYEASNVQPQTEIAFSIPFDNNEGNVITGLYNQQTVFHICMPLPAEYKAAVQATTAVLLWDISASSTTRNRENELDLLQQYFQRVKQQQITLIPFNISMQAAEQFSVSNGNAEALITRLKQLTADGGTQLGAINLNQLNAAEILLFTDGLSTFGKASMQLSITPVTVINSSPSADHAYLKFIAQQTHGKYIDLSSMQPSAAVDRMAQQPFQFIRATYKDAEIAEVYPSTTNNGGFSVAGILKTGSAQLTLHFGYGNTVTETKEFDIQANQQHYEQVKRIWASMKIAQLDLQYQQNKAAITSLGKEFSIVTQNTSLLVLDRVEDYVQYGIVPPVSLQKEYYTLLKEKTQTEQSEKEQAFEQALTAIEEMKDWWNTDYRPKPTKVQQQVLYDSTTTVTAVNSNAGTYAISLYDSITFGSTSSALHFTAPCALRDEEATHFDPFDMDIKLDGKSNASIHPSETIDVQQWKPDVPYLKTLESTAPANYVKVYQQLKSSYAQQPSFFADVARFFFEHQLHQQGLIVLSNICELKLEDAELLRIVANQLLEVNENELAIETFKSIRDIRGEQPQSYRDLALAYQDAGNYQQAIPLLYKVATEHWDDRFGQIKAIALNEMNAIISAHPDAVLTGMDKRLINAMPVDARIVINWSSDNSDIDLWVTDPKNEKCYYSNKQTNTGGRISNDVTRGYGPEEFMVRKATNGKYKVELNLFGDTRQTLGGPITVKAALFTNFGKPNQKREIINCRLTSKKEVIQLGALNFKG